MESAPLYPLVIYSSVVVVLVALLTWVSYLLGPRHRATEAADAQFESGIVTVGEAHLRLSAQFYLIAMFFVIFDVEAVFLFAWAIAVRGAGWPGFIEALIFVIVLVAALAYLWRIGALDWGPATGKRSRERAGERVRVVESQTD